MPPSPNSNNFIRVAFKIDYAMSALPPKADIDGYSTNVRFVPIPDMTVVKGWDFAGPAY